MSDLSANSSMDDPVAGLIARVLDGRLDDSERIELLSRLHTDVASRQRYLDQLLLHAMLGKELSNLSTANLGSLEIGLHALPQPVVAVPRRTISPLATACSIALVAALFYGAFFVLSHNLRDKQNLAKKNAPSTSETVATIRETSDVEWSQESNSPLVPDKRRGSGGEGTTIAQNQQLQINSGLIELQLKQGTTLLIEGPADWRITGENSATLTHGKLFARVPQQAIGFSVETPTAKIIDLGTEFGVKVDKRGATNAAVYKGEIKFHILASSTGSPADEVPSRRLTAGQAVGIDADGNLSPVSNDLTTAEEFIRSPRPDNVGKQAPKSSSEIEPLHPYSKAVLAMPDLVGYWRLGEDGSQRARDEVEASIDKPLGRSAGRYMRFTKTDFRRPGAMAGSKSYATQFNGESCLEIDNDPRLAGDWEGLTLAAWIKPDRQQPPNVDAVSLIVGKWANEISGDAYALIYRHSGTLQMGVGNGDSPAAGLSGVGNIPLSANVYHFVVGTWEKATGDYHLYVDGQADRARGRQAAPHRLNAKSYVPVLIGGQRANNSRYFAGEIDEVSIFSRALTSEEVLELFRLATNENQDSRARK